MPSEVIRHSARKSTVREFIRVVNVLLLSIRLKVIRAFRVEILDHFSLPQKMQDLQHNSSMQHKPDTTMIFPFDPFDRMEIGTTFIGTEIFPAVLHSLLDEVEERGYSHIVSWQPHGRWYVA